MAIEPDRTNLVRRYGSRTRKLSAVKPYSRALLRGALGDIDGRSAVGRFLRGYERQLLKHFGGEVDELQRAMIVRAARLACHLDQLDQKVFKHGHSLTAHDYTSYCAWNNSLVRTLARIRDSATPNNVVHLRPEHSLDTIMAEAKRAAKEAAK